MICNNVILTVRDEAEIDKVARLLTEQGRLSREEPGCLRFEAYQSDSDPRVFMLIERWESPESLDAHRNARAYQEIYKPQVLPRVDRIPHPSRILE